MAKQRFILYIYDRETGTTERVEVGKTVMEAVQSSIRKVKRG